MIPTLPDFTRFQWASVTEKQWFEPLVRSASNAFIELERLSVAAGIRKAAWQFVSFNELVPLSEWAREQGLIVIPVHNACVSGSYSSSGGQQNGHNAYRVVLTRPEDYKEVLPFVGDEHIGQMLGFPSCCRQAFAETWAKGSVDTTWEQVATGRPSVMASTLLRWMGLRFVPHLPCRYDCEASQALGRQFLELGIKSGFTEDMKFIEEALNWPMSGTRLFGIAELITPPLKIVTRSTWTPTKEEFFVPGSYTKPTRDLWSDNGFSEPSAMREAHTFLVNVIKEHAPARAHVLDLGCGNGLLLKRAKMHRPDIKISGIDVNGDAIRRVKNSVLSNIHWFEGRIQDLPWTRMSPDLVLINPARLTEMDIKDAQTQRDNLVDFKTIVYCYSDYDSLEKLCMAAGLPAPRMLVKSPLVSIGIL